MVASEREGEDRFDKCFPGYFSIGLQKWMDLVSLAVRPFLRRLAGRFLGLESIVLRIVPGSEPVVVVTNLKSSQSDWVS